MNPIAPPHNLFRELYSFSRNYTHRVRIYCPKEEPVEWIWFLCQQAIDFMEKFPGARLLSVNYNNPCRILCFLVGELLEENESPSSEYGRELVRQLNEVTAGRFGKGPLRSGLEKVLSQVTNTDKHQVQIRSFPFPSAHQLLSPSFKLEIYLENECKKEFP